MDIQKINWVLVGVLAVLALFTIRGYRKGFLRRVVSMFSLVITIGLSAVLTDCTTAYIVRYTSINDEWEARLLGFLLSFLIITVALRLTVMSLDAIAHLPVIKGVNKLAGALLGLAEALIAIWVVFLAADLFSDTEPARLFMAYVDQSDFLRFLYKENLILKILAN